MNRPRIFPFALLLLSIIARAQTAPAPFKFGSSDKKLLDDADQFDQQYEKKGLVYSDPKADQYLREIGARLTGDAPPPERVTYRFRILRDPMVNAFALPNGSVYVNTGLVAVLENEAELASVLGHEVTHVTDRHTYLLNRSIRRKAVTMEVIAGAASVAGYFPIGALFGNTLVFAAQVSQVFIISTVYGYSQNLEHDADVSGYGRLIRAGYDGAAMAKSLQLLDEKLEFEPTEPYWRTHPKLEERIATAQKLAQTENAPHPRATGESDYLEHMAGVIRYNESLDLDNRRARTAVARAGRLVQWEPKNPTDLTLLADGYRSLGAKSPGPDQEELTRSGKAAARKEMLKMTAEEEQKALLGTPSGPRTLAANQAKAEELYGEAIAADPRLAAPHRGLGMLYQDQSKFAAAAREYRAYLDLAPPQAIDRLRIERRLAAMNAKAADAK